MFAVRNRFHEALDLTRQSLVRFTEDRAEHLAGGVRRISGGAADAAHTHTQCDNNAAQTQNRSLASDASTTGLPTPALSTVPGFLQIRPLGELIDAGNQGADEQALLHEIKGFERRFGPYDLEINSATYEDNQDDKGNSTGKKVSIVASITDNGADAGFVTRVFERDEEGKLIVLKQSMHIEKDYRGQGFSSAFSKAEELYYIRSGVDRIYVHASQDGGYTWAKAGYEWDTHPGHIELTRMSMVNRIDTYTSSNPELSEADKAWLNDCKNAFLGDASEFPSPRALAEHPGESGSLGRSFMKGSNWYGIKYLQDR